MAIESIQPANSNELPETVATPAPVYSFDMGYYQGVTEEFAADLSREQLVANLREQNIKWVEATIVGNSKQLKELNPIVDVISATLDRRVSLQNRTDRRNNRHK